MRPDPERIIDHREYPVLYVDDEPENLRIFELTFRREFSILKARSGAEALEILHQQPVAVVLSDHRMPEMTGTDFLTQVREFDPRTVRLLVTAYGDAATLAQAINDGSIHRYVPKPWDPDEMRVTVRQAIELHALETERENLIAELTTLHGVSQTISRQLDLDPLIDLLLHTTVEDLSFDGATIWFFDDDRTQLEARRCLPGDGPVAGYLDGRVLSRSDAPDLLESLCEGRSELFALDGAFEAERGMRSLLTEVAADQVLAVPLVGTRGTLGAIFVDNRRGGRRFRATERTLLEGLAGQAAIALENARLVSDLRGVVDRSRGIDDVARVGALAMDLAESLRPSTEAIREFLAHCPVGSGNGEDWSARRVRALEQAEGVNAALDTFAEMRDAGTERSCDLGELIVTVANDLADRAAGEGVLLEVERELETVKVTAAPGHLRQVLFHLIERAVRATPAGGRVVVRAGARAEEAWLEVIDQSGSPEAELAAVFDPFERPDAGEGAALLVCEDLAERMGGRLAAQATSEQGACFRLHLPRS